MDRYGGARRKRDDGRIGRIATGHFRREILTARRRGSYHSADEVMRAQFLVPMLARIVMAGGVLGRRA
jgi:hypothetical protein